MSKLGASATARLSYQTLSAKDNTDQKLMKFQAFKNQNKNQTEVKAKVMPRIAI